MARTEIAELRDHIVAWSSAALAANFLLLLLLAFLCPWWAGKKVASGQVHSAKESGGWWFWVAVATAISAMMFMTIPRLGHSLWDDEETSVRFAVVGRHLRNPTDEKIKFHEASWAETFFYYKQPNNHVFHNILARTSNSLWLSISAPQSLHFSEVALRAPAFLAGAAGILSLALLLKSAGFAAAGAVAAWLLAFHPWYQRYACEARGYSLVLALLPAAVLVWHLGLRTGRWRWWATLAVLQLALVWTYPASLFFLLPLALATPILATFGRSVAHPAAVSMARWFCTQSLAAIFTLQVMAPLVPQARDYFRPLDHSQVDHRWLSDYLSYLAFGLPWASGVPDEQSAHPDLGQMTNNAPVFWIIAALIALILTASGAYGILRQRDPIWKTAFLCGLAGPCLQLAYAAWQRFTIWEWYLIYLLPWVVALAAIGIERSASFFRHRVSAALPMPLLLALPVAGYALMTKPVRQWQAERPVTPTRDSVLLTRPTLDPDDPDNLLIMTAGLTNPPASYDARVFFVKDIGELVLLCRMADATNRPLWLNIGHLWALQADHPEAYRVVLDGRLFDSLRVLRGHSHLGDRMVCRYIPESMDRQKSSAILTPEDEIFIERNLSRRPEEYFSTNF